MERMTVTMSEDDVDDFERGRQIAKMSKSAYIRLLIAEHENRVPPFIQYKEIIEKLADTMNLVKQILASDKISDADKLHIYTAMESMQSAVFEAFKEKK